MIGEREREALAQRGLVRLEGLIPETAVAEARELVLAALEAAGLWRDGRWLADRSHGWEAAQPLRRKLKSLAKSAAFAALVPDEVREAARQLAGGQPLRTLMDRPQILFTPPDAERWSVPHRVWHLDVPRLGALGTPGLQMFSFLDAVAPGGGGTVVVAGSHRLLNDQGRIRSKEVKRRLRREPYFRDLMGRSTSDRQRFVDEPGRVGAVELQVVELCGRPGDVILTDLRLLHSLAPNASSVPRLMVTQRFFVESRLKALTATPAPARTQE